MVEDPNSTRSQKRHGTFFDDDDSPTNQITESNGVIKPSNDPDNSLVMDSSNHVISNSPETDFKGQFLDEVDELYNSLVDSVNASSRDVAPLDDSSMNNLMDLSTSSSRSSAWYRNITVEPVILIFSLAMTLTAPVNTALYLEHTCVSTLGFNETYCRRLEGTSDLDLEAIVQPKANVFMMASTLVETCVPAVLTLFVGPWSDLHGRKTFLVLPLLGYSLKYAMCLAFSFYPGLSPAYLLLASVPVSLAGGLVSMISLAYCYITDITSEQRRGFRMGMVEAGFYTGLLVGLAASTYLFQYAGYLGIYATSAAISFAVFLYAVCFLPESVRDAKTGKSLSGLFDVRLVRGMLATCCKKRDRGRRAVIFLVVAALSATVFVMEGESTVVFLFTRKKFAWDIQHFTTYGSVNILLQVVGTVVGVSVLSAWLGGGDGPLALASFGLKVVSSALLAASPAEWWMYLASAAGMFGAFAGPLCRSILSKAVDHQDVGKVFSLLSAVEAVTPLAAVPLYTLIYNATLASFPGACFLVSAAIYAADLLLLGAVVVIQRASPAPVYTPISIDG